MACLDALAALSVTAALDGSDQVDVACAHALEDAESVEVRRAAALCAGAAKCLSRGRLVHRVAEDPDPTVRIACAQFSSPRDHNLCLEYRDSLIGHLVTSN